jgi:DNA repair protein RadC
LVTDMEVANMTAEELKYAVAELKTRAVDGRVPIDGPEVVESLCSDLVKKVQEHFVTLTLDGGGKLIKKRTIFVGTLNQTVVHPREVFVSAISDHAAGVVLVHNHPSGRTEPSREDMAITHRLVKCGKLVGIDIVDHVILGQFGLTSMKREDLLGED